MSKLLVGCLEACSLPELRVNDLLVRIDTGAQTSSLHVDRVRRSYVDGKPYVNFELHPNVYNINDIVECQLPLIDIRRIKSSNGTSEQRLVVKTLLQLGARKWPIEITLTNRQDMSYLMLLGRQAMAGQVLVDPEQSFLASNPSVSKLDGGDGSSAASEFDSDFV